MNIEQYQIFIALTLNNIVPYKVSNGIEIYSIKL